MRRATAGEEGFATVIAVGVVVVVATLLVGVLAVVGAAVTAHRAASAADLGALAGASTAGVTGDDGAACGAARAVAEANGGRLDSCAVQDGDVLVTVAVDAPRGLPFASATARSRAGPQPEDDDPPGSAGP